MPCKGVWIATNVIANHRQDFQYQIFDKIISLSHRKPQQIASAIFIACPGHAHAPATIIFTFGNLFGVGPPRIFSIKIILIHKFTFNNDSSDPF